MADRWPAGYRCALSVTIDVDGRYGETNFRPDDMYWISQTAYDPRGTERLLAVLADRETLATFCWVGRAAEDHPLHMRAAVAAFGAGLNNEECTPARKRTMPLTVAGGATAIVELTVGSPQSCAM